MTFFFLRKKEKSSQRVDCPSFLIHGGRVRPGFISFLCEKIDLLGDVWTGALIPENFCFSLKLNLTHPPVSTISIRSPSVLCMHNLASCAVLCVHKLFAEPKLHMGLKEQAGCWIVPCKTWKDPFQCKTLGCSTAQGHGCGSRDVALPTSSGKSLPSLFFNYQNIGKQDFVLNNLFCLNYFILTIYFQSSSKGEYFLYTYPWIDHMQSGKLSICILTLKNIMSVCS